jgi:hypothetical protein
MFHSPIESKGKLETAFEDDCGDLEQSPSGCGMAEI